ncbi:predicted protein [Nematostella vectensis]|uniref:Dual OB-containing domain-containing protein n=1 Tax=Nematostella vectensis TaxID=45351 RepID=A7SKQ0_NEMVE|nr:predicted protein [Nematostella vectensis]|eukprot:XP_001627816.1 predicted protein [Nematostella vectensis]
MHLNVLLRLIMPGDHRIVLIAKTDFGDGYCYLGWDIREKKICRPIPDRSDGYYSWHFKHEYDVGKAYEFTSKDIAQNWYPKTPEDIGVSGKMSIIEENPMPNMFAELEAIAKNSVEEIWPNIIEDFTFVRQDKNTNHNSTGILKCRRDNLHYYKYSEHGVGKERMFLKNNKKYNFPLQVIDHNLGDIPEKEDVLVVLGLARPLQGKCYIMAIGLLTP